MSPKKKKKEPEYIELDEMNVIVQIPKCAADLVLEVQYFDSEGKTVKVKAHYDNEMIQEARKDFLDNVEDGDDYDVRYAITDYGREWLRRIEAGDPQAIAEMRNIFSDVDALEEQRGLVRDIHTQCAIDGLLDHAEDTI